MNSQFIFKMKEKPTKMTTTNEKLHFNVKTESSLEKM